MTLQSTRTGKFPQLIAIMVIIRKSPEFKKIPDSIVGEFDFRSTDHIASQQGENGIRAFGKNFQKGHDAGEKLAIMAPDPLIEVTEISVQQGRHVFG